MRSLSKDIETLVREEGIDGLDRLPGIGPSLAAAIDEIVRTGGLRFLSHLEGEHGTEAAFTDLPGLGPVLARRVASALDIHTLEELEIAANDGRLDRVRGLGARRIAAVRNALEVALHGSARRRAVATHERPTVPTLLEIDARYRTLAQEDRLPKIAPRHLNPGQVAWLPVLHSELDGWHFTALFSNTARAHDVGMTKDWVVIYAERDGREVQQTVVTETFGPLRGQRVVRGRERESRHPIARAV